MFRGERLDVCAGVCVIQISLLEEYFLVLSIIAPLWFLLCSWCRSVILVIRDGWFEAEIRPTCVLIGGLISVGEWGGRLGSLNPLCIHSELRRNKSHQRRGILGRRLYSERDGFLRAQAAPLPFFKTCARARSQ